MKKLSVSVWVFFAPNCNSGGRGKGKASLIIHMLNRVNHSLGSTLGKDLGVQTDNVFSSSDLIFQTRRSFQDLSESAFIPLYE